MSKWDDAYWQNAVYRGRRCRIDGDDLNFGPRVDFGDGLIFKIGWGDPDLIVDPSDCEWENAEPMLAPLPGVTIDEETGDGWLFR